MKRLTKVSIVLSLTVAAMMSGCSSTKTTSVISVNDIEHKQTAEIRAFSGQKANVLGPVFFKQDGPCSEVDFLKFINTQMPNAHDVIHVRMEYHKVKEGMTEKEYCKYFGIPVAYTDMPIDEVSKWVATYEPGKVVVSNGDVTEKSQTSPEPAPAEDSQDSMFPAP